LGVNQLDEVGARQNIFNKRFRDKTHGRIVGE
jgi:hypothetical protein